MEINMNILAIGNSFSEDATRYLHGIARADGVYTEVLGAAIGGCSFEWHYRNMLADRKDYMLFFNGSYTGFKITLKEALLSREWDVITIQQVSHLSFNKDTYQPYATALASYIRQLAPKARLLLQQTWAYEEGTDRLHNIAGYRTGETMLADIKRAYSEICEEVGFDGIIPSGELFGKLLENGIPRVHRDTFHATLGLGRYALGLLWYRMLTGKSVADNKFCDFDEPISDEEIAIVKRCVDSFEV
ncbi:MAG: DUF4886 domain-containing protein [Clostridia bacterium]|nr:DUF4886 domain-containing protein [Clostridia bacterium]